ncbi:hypothetical protein Lepto7375DRAFT_0830 [Leptolyngbya sp. PCC 7375]|nr:hypothetical protein Lepto7375DRAFT_0830 [Leptolyngbya sp. PCC 7375]
MLFSWKHKSDLKDMQQKHTERVAYELYENRTFLDRQGNQQQDWKTAERIVQNDLRTTLFAINRPLIKLEKYLVEPFNKYLRQSAIFDVVERISPAIEAIGILLIPVVLYLASQAYENQRESQEIERLQQTSIQNHLSQLSDILLNVEGDLRSENNQPIRTVATATTLTLLRDPNLNSQRKGQVIESLYQMNFVGSGPGIEDPVILTD